MKKSVYVIMAMMLLSFVACNRFRPRVNHSEQMEQVRIPVDTAQKNDIKEATEDDWQDEPLLEIPDIPGEAGAHPDASGADRMFREGY